MIIGQSRSADEDHVICSKATEWLDYGPCVEIIILTHFFLQQWNVKVTSVFLSTSLSTFKTDAHLY